MYRLYIQYFIFHVQDIGYLDPLPQLKTKDAAENVELKKNKNDDTSRSTPVDSELIATSSKLTQYGASSWPGITTSKINNNQAKTNKQKQQQPQQYDPYAQGGKTWESKSEPDAMLMDSTNDETDGHDQGSKKGQSEVEIASRKGKHEKKDEEKDKDKEEDIVVWNACNQYHMKLPFFVEFRDDS